MPSIRTRLLTVVTALTAAVLAAPAAAATAPDASGVPALGTVRDVHAAMRGEAFAHASYTFFSAEARAEGHHRPAELFARTARVELHEHFTEESALIDYVGSDEANLRHAIEGETYEATYLYPTLAEQARQDGDTRASELFTEIAADENDHRTRLTRALKVLTSGSGTTPRPPAVDRVEVPAGPPQVASARTRANLDEAMHGEALAHATYVLFAQHAARSGHHQLADLFAGLAEVELREHFAGEARLAGLVGDTRSNLRTAISGERYEASVMYPTFARRANAAGDKAAGSLFTEIAHDESRHAAQFEQALRELG